MFGVVVGMNTFRQMKNTNFELLNRDLSYAPWHVGHIFTDIDDKYDYWKCLFDSVQGRRHRGLGGWGGWSPPNNFSNFMV